MRRLLVLILVLSTAAACDRPPATTATPSQSAHSSGHPVPNPSGGHEDPYVEAAEKYQIDEKKVVQAQIDARLEMLKLGGPEGQNLKDKFLDTRILDVFAKGLGVAKDKAETVMRFLMDEWKEYEEDTEKEKPGLYARWNANVAKELGVSLARAIWIGTLLFNRSFHRDVEGYDPVFLAVAADLKVDPKRLADVVDALKKAA